MAVKNWVQLNLDANGESLLSLALSSDNKTIYACTYNSLFKSTDGGTDWTQTNSGWPKKSINSIVADPVAPATIYAVEALTFFKSTDAGETWNPSDPDSTESVNAIVIDPSNNQTIYAVTSEYNGEEVGEVFESTDGGQSWQGVNTQMTNTQFQLLVLSSGSQQRLYADATSGLLVSKDQGKTWTTIGTGLNYALSLAIDPTDQQNMYAGTMGGVYKSTDGGLNWKPVTSGLNQEV